MVGTIFGVSAVSAAVGCILEWFFGPYSLGGVGAYLGALGLVGSLVTAGWVFSTD